MGVSFAKDIHAAIREIHEISAARPSLFDAQPTRDTAVTPCDDAGTLVLYVNNHPVAVMRGFGPDLASFNSMLTSLRHRAWHDDMG